MVFTQMAIGYSRYLKLIYALGDLFLLNFSFACISFLNAGHKFNVDVNFLSQFLYINFFWILIGLSVNINELDRALRYEQVIKSILKTVIVHFLLLVAFNFFIAAYIFPIENFLEKYLLFVTLLIVWRTIMILLIYFVRRRGLNYRRVIIVGGGDLSEDINVSLHSHPEMGYKMLGVFVDKNDFRFNGLVKGKVGAVEKFALENAVDEIYCSITELENEQVGNLMRFADKNLIRFKIIPDFRGFHNKKVQIDFYDSVPVLSVRSEPLQSFFNRTIKRTFDVLFSGILLLTFFPFAFIIFSLIIKLTSKGPVFFRQKRSGKNNETFTCYKFRTMYVNDKADTEQATANDSRVTPIGKFLRAFSIDELPQFYNVLIGNMSVTGPRPHMLKHTADYAKLIDKFMVRHFIKPGITGWAQVNGLRGETSDTVLMEKRIEYDVWYIENWSMMLDLKIIFLTMKKILSGEIKG
jgi:putative colanic acid biosysnthesis UDP-glucose lipid carrier transferase